MLNLNDMVFQLLELDDTSEMKDLFFELYLKRVHEIVHYHGEEWEDALSILPNEIYQELIGLKDGVMVG